MTALSTRPPPPSFPEGATIISQFQIGLPGLGEGVTHIFYTDGSGFLHKRTLRADGSVAPLATLLEADRTARETESGRMHPGLVKRLEEAAPQETIEVGIVFDPRIDEEEYLHLSEVLAEEERERGEALRAGEVEATDDGLVRIGYSPRAQRVVEHFARRPALEADLRSIVDDAVGRRAHEVRGRLASGGWALDDFETSTPIIYARLAAADVARLAIETDVSWLFDATGGEAVEQAAPNGMSFHHIDTAMNAAPNNLDGTNQRVGLIENVKCAIHDNHDAFELAPATQYNSSGSVIQTCTTEGAPCAGLCKTGTTDAEGICKQLKSGVLRCVDPHLSKVASGIWGTRFEGGIYKNYGAGKATPYVWTGSNSGATNTACVPTQTQLAYDWFNTNNVKTVVGSYGCFTNGHNVDGFVEDWNAARRNVAIFKATPGGGPPDLTEPGCRAANAVCVGGMTTFNDPIDAWRNPVTSSGYYLDREEPDVVAFAGNGTGTGVEVLDLASTTGWVQAYGTSFANPLVANQAVLLRQKCGGSLDARYLRAILAAGSWYYDPESAADSGLAFSTQPKPGVAYHPVLHGYIDTSLIPPIGFDYKDGGGGPTGENILGWCGTGPSGLTFDGGPITITSNGGTPFTPTGSHGGTYNLTGDEPDGGNEPLSYDTANLFQVWQKVYTFGANTRVRAVFTWDKCTPTAASGPGSGPYYTQNPTEDFDLFLCPTSGGTCQAQSRSVYDTKEGFDVTVAAPGNYRLSIVRDGDATLGCNGSFSHAAGFAVVAGAAANFLEAP